ncbi:Family S53 protease-like protein [Mycena chlorophos]|uniref:tripeptidyl-peptidase II n=1 Tax=Mycena chlorophos TaxID=658473 RepID=A0A8H6RXJ5_MYCCL|nr:Family S53 protease-like protein [Mycena chlorophos]
MSFLRSLAGFLCLLSIAFSASAAAAAAAGLVLHESREAAPAGFVNHGPAAGSHTLSLRVGLASNNIPGLHDKILSISTPGSPEFRQWLSAEQVHAYVAPSNETVNAFNAFVSANNIQTTAASPFGEWVTISLSVDKANALFGAQFTNYTHPRLPKPIMRTLSVSLPSELAGHVDVLHPTTAFSVPRTGTLSMGPSHTFPTQPWKGTTVPANCNVSDANPDSAITPACLQALYNIPTEPATHPDNALMVTAYLDQWAVIDDLDTFMERFRPDYPAGAKQTLKVISVANGTNPQYPGADNGTEAQLDVEYAAGLATNVPIQFLTVGGDDYVADGADTITYLTSDPKPPTVVTTSYGVDESDVPSSIATKLCDGYGAVTARGISVLFASGDGGAGSDNWNDTGSCDVFTPNFPPSCPYVTSIGSTWGSKPEIATNFTGGGFSNYFSRPSWQDSAVEAFLKTVPSDIAPLINTTGRGYPDLSLQGFNYLIYVDGITTPISGTSASSPSTAALIALVNDQLLSQRKPALGFLNPFLYAHPSVANDITVGRNSGYYCPPKEEEGTAAATAAFDAGVGWDPVTGLGTPDYERVLEAAIKCSPW